MHHFWAGFEKRAGPGTAAAGFAQKAEHAAENVLDYSKMRSSASAIPNWKRKLQAAAPKATSIPKQRSGWSPEMVEKIKGGRA